MGEARETRPSSATLPAAGVAVEQCIYFLMTHFVIFVSFYFRNMDYFLIQICEEALPPLPP